MNAGQDGFRNVSPKHINDLVEGHEPIRSVSRRGSIDHTTCSYLASSGISTRIEGLDFPYVADLHTALTIRAEVDFELYVSPDTMSFQAIRAILFGERDSCQFRRLAPEQFGQLRRGFAGSPCVLNDSSCSDHQYRSQCLIACSRDAAKP